MRKNKTKRKIKIIVLISLVTLLIIALQNNGILTKKHNHQLADVGYTTKIGNKTYSINNQIENDIVPTISAGMIPIKQDGEYWTVVDRTANDWCSYANGQPAYMMLNDGKYQSEEYYQMPDTQEVAKAGTQIHKDSTDLGSLYMYIPRYAYNENGDIIYIRQNTSVAGEWIIPNIFTYKTEKEDYALAGIWVECNSLEETELTNKIEEMNTKDSQYGFISNTKTAIMTEDEQDAIQIFVENLNESVGASIARPLIDNITTPNRSVIHIISTNILEPIQALGHLNNEEERIEISIKYGTVTKVVNGEGEELTLIGGKYIQPTTDVICPYIAIDTNGNLKEVEFDNVVFINNAIQLSELRDNVNAGNNYEGWTVVQTRDIDMSSVCGETIGSWEPIGTNKTYDDIREDRNNTFIGTYDGGYHTISNMYIDSNQYQYLGIFANIYEKTTIKKLLIENCNISNTYNSRWASVGGIVGWNYGGTVEKCANLSGNVWAKNGTEIEAGGIVSASNVNSKVIECYNNAKVYTKDSTSWTHPGGISGWIRDSEISDCYNTGEVYGTGTKTSIGGILSEYPSTNVELNNCYNIGNVSGTGSNNNCGAIVGTIDGSASAITTNNYYLEGQPNASGLGEAKTSSELKALAGTLGKAYIEDTYGINDGYPILEWQLNVPIYAKVYLNEAGDKIEVSIPYCINDIKEVRDENGNILDEVTKNKLYSIDATSGKHTYKVIDEKGNFRQLKLNIEIIRNATDLSNLRNKVNAGTNNFEGVTVIQVADIDMSSVCGESVGSWEPIGSNYDDAEWLITDEKYAFLGIYDGRFHIISNLYMNTDQYISLGMFAYISEKTVVKNIVLENVYIKNTSNDGAKSMIGGITGTNYGIIEKCGVESGYISAIRTSISARWAGCFIGGISGFEQKSVTKECYNKADLYGESVTYNNSEVMVGGIVGRSSDNKIIDCYNTGNISCSGGGDVNSYTGGILSSPSENNNLMKNCYNIGNLQNVYYTGGVCARIQNNSYLDVTNSYYLEVSGQANYSGTGEEKTEEELKALASTLGEAYREDTYGINDGYPILEWELKAKKIVAKAYVNAEEGKIVVEIPFHKYNIVKVVNENGEELSKISNTVFKENMTSGNHVYTIIDNEGNEKKVNLNIRLVNSAESLNAFRDEVNNGNSFAGVTVYQTADIDMSSVCGEDIGSWEPIGATDTYFAGTYDGMYHTISNLYIKSDEYIDLGLFTQINNGTTVQNLVMENIYVENNIVYDDKQFTTVGGIVGLNNGIIKNCGTESGNIKFIKSTNNYYCGVCSAGGITGMNNETGKIERCYNKTEVYSEAPNQSASHAMSGGISGENLNSSGNVIINCYNVGNIIAKSAAYTFTGGISGDVNCSNVGISNCYSIGEIQEASYVGGIIARNWQSTISMDKCYCLANANSGATQVLSDVLKTYAIEGKLGSAYLVDEYEINNGYPILEWELRAKKIIGKAYVNADEVKIIVEVTHHINPINSIAKLVNGIEIPIVMFNETTCKDTLSDGTHTYVVTDSEGNKIQLKVGPIKVLGSANDLCAFRDEVNNGNSFAGVTVYQTADIDLSSVCGEGIGSWEPIGETGATGSGGKEYEKYTFSGTYDGEYHTISNLYVKTNKYLDVGLFACISSDSVIQNLVLENVYVENNVELEYCEDKNKVEYVTAGGIVGKSFGKIKNCGIESGDIKFIKSERKHI